MAVPTFRRPLRLQAPLLVLTLVLAACGDGNGEVSTATTGSSTTTTTTATTTPTTAPVDDASLPGERVEIFPYEGDELMVVGVAADDKLNVRSGPGVEFDVILALDPLARDFVATGHNRRTGQSSFWAQIRVEGQTGWVNTVYILMPGQTEDFTSRLWPDPSDRPSARSMVELGRQVAQRRADTPQSDVVVVDGPSVGDLAEITMDVIGIGDDAVGGERLVIFAEVEDGGRRFRVRSVELTTLCARAVTDDGLCT